MAKIVWHDEEFERIKKSPGWQAWLRAVGEPWKADLNAELNAAEISRGQPVEDGYDYHVRELKDEARGYMVAATARAQAHEARNSSMLKSLPIAGRTVVRGKATNPRKRKAEVGDND